MAFDQSTRNRLQRFVNDVRRVLEEEFTRQLQNDYGLDPDSGTVTELASLRHINDAQRETARILRDTLAHYCASGESDQRQGLDRIVREQAFTVLNRLAALRMAEARGLLIESVGNGFQAKGFQLYARVAGTGLGETGDAYRVYLFSVFDELAQDLPGLFDRYAPQGRLFPRETALLAALKLINAPEIETLWAEDETIGWVYQYFNSKEERKAMRDASSAPRNSRELAVRNQFFTPRYVVEFLVDNTLGRLWFNATSGQTSLRDRCQYLLVKPDETPAAAPTLRDPRTLKLLDPACGSMHFGLYAFDLFAEIYREAWAWEQAHGAGALDVSAQPVLGLKPLAETYADQGAYERDIPRLIIEHNIYGVDIDPRAAQIASLALWLRAQRDWHAAGVRAKERPLVGRGHVVAATAPPAERQLREQFAAGLDHLDAELFNRTLQLLKGVPELGVLLQVEVELPSLIRDVFGEHGKLFKQADMEQWKKAEDRLRAALTEYSRAAQSTYQGRLFAHDALEGLRLIDLCREVFDVVVMNPPFGQATKSLQKYYKEMYPETAADELAATFFSRAVSLLRHGGLIGEISSRTFFYLYSLKEWRARVLFEKAPLKMFLDIGAGELDDAVNETAVYVAVKGGKTDDDCHFGMFHRESDKALALRRFAASEHLDQVYVRPFKDFEVLSDRPLCYWVSGSFLENLGSLESFGDSAADVQMGLAPRDEFRYSRLWWEVDPGKCGQGSKWVGYAKGGELSPYFSDVELVLNARDNLREIKADLNAKYPYLKGNLDWVLHPENRYFEDGLTFGQRTTFLRVSALPSGCYFSVAGKAIFGTSQSNKSLLQSINTPTAQYLISVRREFLEINPQFQEGLVARMPWPYVNEEDRKELSKLGMQSSQLVSSVSAFDETTHSFSGSVDPDAYKLAEASAREGIRGNEDRADRIMSGLVGLSDMDRRFIQSEILPKWHNRSVANWYEYSPGHDEVSFAVGVVFGRWDLRGHATTSVSPFDELPARSPRMLSGDAPAGYPVAVASSGVLHEGTGVTGGLADRVRQVVHLLQPGKEDETEARIVRELGDVSLHEYFARPSAFFDSHLKKYSKSGRRAPIYWPLSTSSGNYTLWLYYPNLNGQSLYTAINDLVGPRLKQLGEHVVALRNKGNSRTREDEKQFETLQAFELELIEFRDALLKLAPAYKPNHDDGVQISAAPLWSLFRHKPWQKVLRDTWEKLSKGDYDWAHLAMNYWPERVRGKCKSDKSLAIAHGLDSLYVEPEAKPKKTRGRKKTGGDE